jgi:hypothetical protein
LVVGNVFLLKDIENGQELALKEIGIGTEGIKNNRCYVVMGYCSKGRGRFYFYIYFIYLFILFEVIFFFFLFC